MAASYRPYLIEQTPPSSKTNINLQWNRFPKCDVPVLVLHRRKVNQNAMQNLLVISWQLVADDFFLTWQPLHRRSSKEASILNWGLLYGKKIAKTLHCQFMRHQLWWLLILSALILSVMVFSQMCQRFCPGPSCHTVILYLWRLLMKCALRKGSLLRIVNVWVQVWDERRCRCWFVLLQFLETSVPTAGGMGRSRTQYFIQRGILHLKWLEYGSIWLTVRWFWGWIGERLLWGKFWKTCSWLVCAGCREDYWCQNSLFYLKDTL